MMVVDGTSSPSASYGRPPLVTGGDHAAPLAGRATNTSHLGSRTTGISVMLSTGILLAAAASRMACSLGPS